MTDNHYQFKILFLKSKFYFQTAVKTQNFVFQVKNVCSNLKFYFQTSLENLINTYFEFQFKIAC